MSNDPSPQESRAGEARQLEAETAVLADQTLRRLHVRTDKLFAALMAVQFFSAVAVALIVSPRTWVGNESSIHIHVYAALGIGGLLAAMPIAMTLLIPGTALSRHTIGVTQVLFSALFIHLSGGRIETHFHLFASMALLAFYRDWKVLVPATLFTGADHLLRGLFWPESVFGVIAAAPWRALEHAAWLICTNVFLAYSCVGSAREIRAMAERQTRLKIAHETVELQIQERTKQLSDKAAALKHEIDERHRLESQLVQAQKLESIGQLAAGIAHEINTPTQYVSHNTQFLQQEIGGVMMILDKYADALDPTKQARSWVERAEEVVSTMDEVDFEFIREEIPVAIEQSLEGLERIAEIIRAMKEFSHPGSEIKEQADLNKAIQSTVTVCRNRWKEAAEMQLDLASDLPAVPCLLGEFNQVILNIVVNGADAIAERFDGSGETGKIRIATRLDGGHVEIRVEDNGCGIPEELHQKIFDPFFTTKEVGKGTGQGLAISRDVIVQKHGGEMLCESTPGHGTVFVIRLPLAPDEPASRGVQAA